MSDVVSATPFERPITTHFVDGSKGTVLVVSSDRQLNQLHAILLQRYGFSVLTGTTYTDALVLLQKLGQRRVDLLVVASEVHGWHHQEGESRPEELETVSGNEWHTANIRALMLHLEGQGTSPKLAIAGDLFTMRCFGISAATMALAGLRYVLYRAADPRTALLALPAAR